jgi:hypothetical protein
MAHLTNIQYKFFILFSDVNNTGYFLLKELSSLIGLRFSIQSLNIRIELHSTTNNPIQLRYKTRSSSSNTNCCKYTKPLFSFHSLFKHRYKRVQK